MPAEPAPVDPPAAVMFDFNGTVSDDEPVLARVFEAVFAEEGVALPAAVYYDRFAGLSDTEIIEAVLTWAGRTTELELCDSLLERRTLRYLEEVARASPVRPAAAEFVRRVCERVPAVVVSGAARAEIEAVLDGAGLAETLPLRVCGDDVARGKPDPEGYLRGLELLNRNRTVAITAAAALAFEDSPVGVAAALAAGARCIAVLGSAPAPRLAAAERILPALDWSIPLIRGWNA